MWNHHKILIAAFVCFVAVTLYAASRTLQGDRIIETTSGVGVTVDGVLLKDGNATIGTAGITTANITSANITNTLTGPGVVPVGTMLAVVPTFNANSWQPPATGVIKDGYMRADGGTVPACADCIIPAGSVLPDMRTKYPKGGSTSGTAGGANTVTIASSNLPTHTHGYSTTTGTEGSHTHAYSTTSGSGTSHTHGDGTYASASGAVTGTIGGSDGTHVHGDTGHAHSQYSDEGKSVQEVTAGQGPAIPWNSGGIAMFTQSTGTGYAVINSTGSGHGHTFSLSYASNDVSGISGAEASHTHDVSGTSNTGTLHSHSVSGTTDNGGFADTAMNNEPAYMEVVWVIRIK